MSSSGTSTQRRAATPGQTTGLRLPMLGAAETSPKHAGTGQRPTFSGGMSIQSLSTRLAAPSASAELLATVEKNRAAAALFKETSKAVKYVSTENAMMEELLHEKHKMLTNTDLAVIMNSVMVRADGARNSSILASRRPPMLRCKAKALCVLEPTPNEEDATTKTRSRTGAVNFAVLLDQQTEDLGKAAESRATYDRMIAEFMTKQQSLSERFAGLL